MNYPFRKKYSLCRIVALILIMLLTVSMLSGCSLLPGKQTPSDPGSNQDSQPSDSSQPPEAPPSTEPSTAPVVTTPPTTEPKKENVAIVKEQLNLRSSPSTGSRVVISLDAGEEVEVARIEPIGKVQWAYVSSETLDVMGWVVTDMLDMSNVTLATGGTSTPGSDNPTDPTETVAPTKPTTPTAVDPITGTGTSTTPANAKMGVVIANDLNIRAAASQTADRVGGYTYGTRVAILETNNGWGRTDKGWISLSYVYLDGNTGTNTASGTVSATQLNVRSGPGTNYDKVTTLSQNARVQILEQVKVGTETWGYTSGGWVSMQYITVDGAATGGNTTTPTVGTTGNATVTANGGLNIRAGAGTNYQVVGALKQGEVITILETANVDGVQWGRTNLGWVSMAFVRMN